MEIEKQKITRTKTDTGSQTILSRLENDLNVFFVPPVILLTKIKDDIQYSLTLTSKDILQLMTWLVGQEERKRRDEIHEEKQDLQQHLERVNQMMQEPNDAEDRKYLSQTKINILNQMREIEEKQNNFKSHSGETINGPDARSHKDKENQKLRDAVITRWKYLADDTGDEFYKFAAEEFASMVKSYLNKDIKDL